MSAPAPTLSYEDFASLSDKGLCNLIHPIYDMIQTLPEGVTWDATIIRIREGMFELGLDIDDDTVFYRVLGLLTHADA